MTRPQITVEVIRAALKWKYVLEYLNDIIVSFKSFEEYIGHVCGILTVLSHTGNYFEIE